MTTTKTSNCPYCHAPVKPDARSANGIAPADPKCKGCEFCKPLARANAK